MSYNRVNPDFNKWATQLHTIEEIITALNQSYDQGYAAGKIDNNWWKQQDAEKVKEEQKQRNDDRESVLVDDKKSSKKADIKMETEE